MESLKRYLTDCESKRRRMRDRPSDAVLSDLRRLLEAFDEIEAPRDRPIATAVTGGTQAPTAKA